MRRFLVLCTVATSVAGIACTASTDGEEASAGEAAISSTTPVTAENFLIHPKITAIVAEMEAVEATPLTATAKGPTPGICGDPLRISIDAAGRTRKFEALSGRNTTTYYFNESRQMHVVSRVSVTQPSSTFGDGSVSEQRVYFYVERSEVRWLEVQRSARWSTQAGGQHPPDITTLPFRASTGIHVACGFFPSFVDRHVMVDPAEVFAKGCVEREAQPSVLSLAGCASP